MGHFLMITFSAIWVTFILAFINEERILKEASVSALLLVLIS